MDMYYDTRIRQDNIFSTEHEQNMGRAEVVIKAAYTIYNT